MTADLNIWDKIKDFFGVTEEADPKTILEIEIQEFLASDKRERMTTGMNYYLNDTDILKKRRDIDWKSNNQIRMGLFGKVVDQKVGYLTSLQPSISAEVQEDNKESKINDLLGEVVFDSKTLKEIKSISREAIIKGVSYAIPYIDEEGVIRLKKVPTEQIICFWKDERREELDAFIRIYPETIYRNGVKHSVTTVEYWDTSGTIYYRLDNGGRLVTHPDKGDDIYPHFMATLTQGDLTKDYQMTWEKVPLITFRYNEFEMSLLERTKPLLDNLELQSSTNADSLADLPKFIYVLKNYGGTRLDEFMNNLNKYRSVKVNENGGVEKLTGDVNTGGVESEIQRTRKAFYEAARAIDTQDDNLGNASGQALKWRYTDLDLDANDFENELQDALLNYMWFVQQWAKQVHKLDIDLDKFSYIFNRDIIINEAEAITNATASRGIIDDQTIRENHPWYTARVEDRLEAERTDREKRYLDEYDFSNAEKDVLIDEMGENLPE